MYEQQSKAENITLWVSVFSVAVILLGLGSILLLSFGKEKEKTKQVYEEPYSSIPFTYKIFKLNISAIAISLIMALLLNDGMHSPNGTRMYIGLSVFLSFIYLIIYLYLLGKRAINVGISALAPLAVMVCVLAIGAGIYLIADQWLTKIPVVISILSSFVYFIINIANVLFFILLILPSEDEKEGKRINKTL